MLDTFTRVNADLGLIETKNVMISNKTMFGNKTLCFEFPFVKNIFQIVILHLIRQRKNDFLKKQT